MDNFTVNLLDMARPKTNIDWETVNDLLEADCEGTEIAAYLGIVPDTLYKRCKETHKLGFSEYLRQKKAKGNSLLKAKQFEKAMSGDKGMLIWLGKQRLGQSEKTRQTLEFDNSEKVIFNIAFRNNENGIDGTADVQRNEPETD